MRSAWVVFVAAVAIVGCAPPGQSFVGDWDGTYECDGQWDDGSRYVEGPLPQIVRIARDSTGELYQAGQGCTLPLRVVGETRLSYVPSRCETVTPGGTLLLADIISGNLDIVSGVLRYQMSNRVTFPDGSYFTSTCRMNDGYGP